MHKDCFGQMGVGKAGVGQTGVGQMVPNFHLRMYITRLYSSLPPLPPPSPFSLPPASPFKARSILGDGAVDKMIGSLLYHMATRFKGSEERSAMLMTYVCSKKIATEPQITGVCIEVWVYT